MCTTVILYRPDHDWPLILGANRDEMIQRPCKAPAHHWPDRPGVVGGLDLQANGSWLGVNATGVAACILNRHGSLGPAEGFRSRGELVLEALDHADATASAEALRRINPKAYRPFNMLIADNENVFWLKHTEPTPSGGIIVTPVSEGLTMLTAGEINDRESGRIRRYYPLFEQAAPPDPERNDYRAWEDLLASTESGVEDGPSGAMRFVISEKGFATVSSALVMLPHTGKGGNEPRFRFTTWLPQPEPWREVWD
jgi:hypothetical protein